MALPTQDPVVKKQQFREEIVEAVPEMGLSSDDIHILVNRTAVDKFTVYFVYVYVRSENTYITCIITALYVLIYSVVGGRFELQKGIRSHGPRAVL